MKKIISSYRIFTPDLYTIFGTIIGSLLLCVLSFAISHTVIPEIAMLIIPVSIVMLDLAGDLFIFSGVFSKGTDFGLLATSQKGFGILKAGVLGDQLRRFLQITVVTIVNGLILKDGLFEKGFFTSELHYAGFLTVLILTLYCGNTLILFVTRRYTNFTSGLLTMSLCSCLEVLVLFGFESLFLKEGDPNPLPLMITMVIIAVAVTYAMCESINLKFMDSFGTRAMGRFGDDARRKMAVFLLTAFGCSFLMIPAMKVGFDADADLSAMMIAQMMYPACGVILAKLLSYNEKPLPKAAFITVLFTGMITLILAGVSIINPAMVEVQGMKVSAYYSVSSTVIIISSILFFIMILAAKREKKENAGLTFPKAGKSLLFVLLFVILYFTYVIFASMLQALFTGSNVMEAMNSVLSIFAPDKEHPVWFSLALELLTTWLPVLINLPLTFVMFLGEEYGWRYFLQPKMQQKFGVTLGTILLGIAWGIWHTGADLMFYSSETGLQMLTAQIIACISLGIFMGYAYMKTENIWVPVMMHFFNNTLITVLAGNDGADAMSAMTGKVIGWELIPIYFIGYAVFWAFIFTPTMRGKKTENLKEAENV